MRSEAVRPRRTEPAMRPRQMLPELEASPRMPQEQARVSDLRERIEKNRTRWLDNAKNSPLSQRPRMKLMSGAPGFAVITGLATVITVAAGLIYNEAGKATRLAQIPAAPQVTKAAETPAPAKAAEAPAPAKATQEPEIIKAEDSPADPAPKTKKTIVSRIVQE